MSSRLRSMVLHMAFSGRSLAAVPKGIFQLFRQRIPRQKGVGDKHRDKRRHGADRRPARTAAACRTGTRCAAGSGYRRMAPEWSPAFTTAQHVRQLIEFVVHQPVGDVAELARLPQLANFCCRPAAGSGWWALSWRGSPPPCHPAAAAAGQPSDRFLRSWCFRLQLKATR